MRCVQCATLTLESEGTVAHVALRLVVTEGPVEGLSDRAWREGHGLVLVEPPVGQLETLCAVLTRDTLTLGDVLLAVLASVAGVAVARVVVDQVVASGVVLARVGQALVDVDVAMLALVTRPLAVATVRVDPIDALAAVETRLVLTTQKQQQKKISRRHDIRKTIK